MMKEIINFISNINIIYITLSILFLIASLLFLYKKNVDSLAKKYFAVIYIGLIWVSFFYIGDILKEIFKLQLLSVKLYLVLLVIGNIIMLITINKNIQKTYKFINTILFISNVIILTLNIITIVGNKYSYFATTTLKDSIKLMNINIIIFIIYLNVLCLTYIIKEIKSILKTKKEAKKLVIEKPNIKEVIEEKETELKIPPKLKYYREDEEDGFFIDGVNCSIIFEDTNEENIIKNYYILLNDINAKLTNGYTLKENILIKDIINRLNIKDLNNINIDVNKLNKITVDEYNLLKRYLSSNHNY